MKCRKLNKDFEEKTKQFTYLRIIIIINFSNIEGKEQASKTTVRLNDLGGGDEKNKEDKSKMVKKGSKKSKITKIRFYKNILKKLKK